MSNKHPHAELAALYAQDMAETDKPYLRWEHRASRHKRWFRLADHPQWSIDMQYRRRPQPITINGHKVPKPLTEAPDSDVFVPTLCPYSEYTTFSGILSKQFAVKNGIAHATKEDAIAHSEAILSLTRDMANE